VFVQIEIEFVGGGVYRVHFFGIGADYRLCKSEDSGKG
jgi:hypothetical protein